MSLPEKVTIWEVGPRDGLQNESALVPTPTKVAFIRRLVAAFLLWIGLAHDASATQVEPDKDLRIDPALCLAAAACALPMLTMKPFGFVVTCTGCFVLVIQPFRFQPASHSVMPRRTYWLSV